MQSNFKAARKIVGMALFSAVLCMFVQFSFHFMIKSFSTEVVGYTVCDAETGEEIGYIDKADRPDTAPDNIKYLSVFSDVPKSAKAVEVVLSMICSLGILFCTTGSVLANVAAKDRNDCDFNGAEYNKNKGIIIGLLAAIPSAILYAATLILRFVPSSSAVNWYFWFYRFIAMGPVKPLNDVLTGSQTVLAEAPIWWVVLQGLFTVLFVLFCYIMYRICYNEDSVIAKALYKSAQKDQNIRRLGSR